jgi:hypothetical protein
LTGIDRRKDAKAATKNVVPLTASTRENRGMTCLPEEVLRLQQQEMIHIVAHAICVAARPSLNLSPVDAANTREPLYASITTTQLNDVR